MEITATHVGTATVLLRIGELTVLTDPVFDPAGSEYVVDIPARGMSVPLWRTAGPAITAEELPPIDLVLLSHDEHADNLDHTGRALLATASTVITTKSGSGRLGGNAIGLAPWESHDVVCGKTRIKVTATPARHGPEGIEPIMGDTIGFVVEVPGAQAALYISGDTVYYDALDEIGRRFGIGTALLHMGDAHFPAGGDIRFSMNGQAAAALARSLGARSVVPIHYESWAHLTEKPEEVTAAFDDAGLDGLLRWLDPGRPYPITWPTLTV
ncbi:MBL fold metallo-hydrolase [Streptomyces lunaelactis]|uniref:MBL fold metallo-hydrolase n=1 Tax=Streptomyces lunaelactis TaxID=1535768 RepID=UPI00158547C9|nr:MBL fold metallo-hydrolase [Streptomyces lunaelactis]NUK07137.1 MBL fold metallo-hydrolase [Streptomyces lunaelactis]NUL09844.1 MBL fold metallo-hydrolase [Streptomyces lunaelactis]NUL25928.1 MBL fold metallo-hydrolase [Streptomyces lunaelactis]